MAARVAQYGACSSVGVVRTSSPVKREEDIISDQRSKATVLHSNVFKEKHYLKTILKRVKI